ncbi:hypothetical protein Hanom_Chr10g00888681 [Helianthus anomalus]
MINTSHNAWTNPFDVYDVPAPQRARVLLLVIYYLAIYKAKTFWPTHKLTHLT